MSSGGRARRRLMPRIDHTSASIIIIHSRWERAAVPISMRVGPRQEEEVKRCRQAKARIARLEARRLHRREGTRRLRLLPAQAAGADRPARENRGWMDGEIEEGGKAKKRHA